MMFDFLLPHDFIKLSILNMNIPSSGDTNNGKTHLFQVYLLLFKHVLIIFHCKIPSGMKMVTLSPQRLSVNFETKFDVPQTVTHLKLNDQASTTYFYDFPPSLISIH
jgi:hypothetical protein